MIPLFINQLAIYYLSRSATNVVHLLCPLHLIVRLELFGNTITLCHLVNQLQEHILRLSVYVCEVIAQYTFRQQICKDSLG